MEIARLTAVIDAETGRFKTGMAGVEAQLAATKAQMNGMTATSALAGGRFANFGKVGAVALAGVATAGIAAGAAVALGVGYSIKAFADFDKQMAQVRAVTGASAAQMDAMKKSALDAGMTTKFSATEAAAAQVELGKAGLSTKQIMGGGFKSTLALAAAGNMNLADAASTTANVLGTFNMSAKDSMHIADGLATAANATTADVSDFAMAFQMGGSAAKLAGMNFDEATVALMALAKIGVKGSDAGTSLKASLTQIAKPTDQAREAMDKYHLAFFKADGSMKSVADISKMLRSETAGLTKQQRLALFATVAGTDGMRTLAAMYASTPAEIAKYTDAVGKKGTAEQQAKTMNDNMSASFKTLMNTLNATAIMIGDALAPAVTLAVDGLTSLIRAFSQSGAIESFATGVQTVSTAIRAMFGGGDSGAAGQASKFGTTMQQIGTILSGLSGPISTISSAIRGNLINYFNMLMAVAKPLMPILMQTFTVVGPPIARLVVAVATIAAAFVKLQATIMGTIFKVLATILPPIISAIGPIFMEQMKVIGAVIDTIAALLSGDWAGAWKNAKKVAVGIFQTIPQKIGELVLQIASVAGEKALEIGSQLVTGIKNGIEAKIGEVKSFIEDKLGSILDSIDIPGHSPPQHAAMEAIGKPLAEGVRIGFLEGTKDLPEKMSERLKNALGKAKEGIDSQTGMISAAFGRISDIMLRAFDNKSKQIVDKVKAPFQQAMAQVENEIKGRMASVAGAFDVKIQGARDSGAALTPAEAELASMRSAYDQQQRERDKADALAAMDAAAKEGDAKAIADAQRRYNDILYAEKVRALEETAAAERTQRDKTTADTVAGYETDKQNALAALESERQARLAALQTQQDDAVAAREFQREQERIAYEARLQRMLNHMTVFNKQWKGNTNELVKYLGSKNLAGLMAASGEKLGTAFSDALDAMTGDQGQITKAIRGLAEKLQAFLRLRSPAKEGPLSKINTWWKAMPDTLLSGVDTSMIGQVAASIASPDGFSVGGRSGASGQSVTIVVNVEGSVTAEADLAETIRKELIKTGQRNGTVLGGF